MIGRLQQYEPTRYDLYGKERPGTIDTAKRNDNIRKRKKKTRANGTGTVYKRGNTYTAEVVVGWTDDGRPIRRTKGGFRTKKEAYEYIPILKTMKKQSEQKALEAASAAKEYTFAQLFEKWIERHENRVGVQAIACHKAAFNHYRTIHNTRFTELTTAMLNACVEDCPRGWRTKENMKILGTSLYDYAIEIGIAGQNLAKYIWIGQKEKGPGPLAFSTEQLNLILKAAEEGIPYADYIACLCYLGFRPTGFLQLLTEDYNADEQYVIGGIKTDAGKRRVVPISPKIKKYIDNRIATGYKYIFPGDDGLPMNQNVFRKNCFYPALAEIGIQPIPQVGERAEYSPRSCRNTFATLMKNVAGSEKDKSALMGHASFKTTLGYQREDYESKRQIIQSI